MVYKPSTAWKGEIPKAQVPTSQEPSAALPLFPVHQRANTPSGFYWVNQSVQTHTIHIWMNESHLHVLQSEPRPSSARRPLDFTKRERLLRMLSPAGFASLLWQQCAGTGEIKRPVCMRSQVGWLRQQNGLELQPLATFGAISSLALLIFVFKFLCFEFLALHSMTTMWIQAGPDRP